jgi:putative salt-induced outer membrane protein YdiY
MLRTASIVCLILGGVALADEIQFKNGDRLSGKIDRLEDGKLVITTAVAGEVKVSLADVKTFSTEGPIEIHLADGNVINQKIVSAEAGKIATAPGAAIQGKDIPLEQIKKVNPVKVKWTGDLSAGLLLTRGDSYSDNFSLALNAMRRGEDDRITFGAAYLYGKTRSPDTGEKSVTTDNWFAQLKYDYFFAPKWYGYGQARVEKDRIAELDLRLMAGAGVGYQWIERETLNFSTEAGLTWLFEDYSNATPKSDTIAVRLAYHVDHKLNENVALFHNLQYFPSLEDLSDYFITTDAGVRAGLTKSMFAEFKVELNYDSTPAEGATTSNLRWIINVGWAF